MNLDTISFLIFGLEFDKKKEKIFTRNKKAYTNVQGKVPKLGHEPIAPRLFAIYYLTPPGALGMEKSRKSFLFQSND